MVDKNHRPEDLIADLRSLASLAKEKFGLHYMSLKDIHIVDMETLYQCSEASTVF
jgi:hypothetical protein